MAGVVGVAVSGLFLSACGGQSADSLGHQACVEVHHALSLYAQAGQTSDAALAQSDRSHSLTLLRNALRPAALAGSSDGDWQALMTTLSETNRVPESNLVTALTAQCAATLANS